MFSFLILTLLREHALPPPSAQASIGLLTPWPSSVYGRRRIAFVIFNDHVLKLKIWQPKTDHSNGVKRDHSNLWNMKYKIWFYTICCVRSHVVVQLTGRPTDVGYLFSWSVSVGGREAFDWLCPVLLAPGAREPWPFLHTRWRASTWAVGTGLVAQCQGPDRDTTGTCHIVHTAHIQWGMFGFCLIQIILNGGSTCHSY